MDTPMNNSGFGATNANDMGKSRSNATETCASCGQPLNRGLEQFLGRLGISNDMINNLRTSMQDIDVDEYLDTARDYLKTNSDKAKTFAKDNPGKVAAGVAVLAVGAGLLISALHKD